MSARTKTEVAEPTTCSGDSIVHYYCCNEAVAFCGSDVANEPECPDDCGCEPCVVCDDLAEIVCPRCGA